MANNEQNELIVATRPDASYQLIGSENDPQPHEKEEEAVPRSEAISIDREKPRHETENEERVSNMTRLP